MQTLTVTATDEIIETLKAFIDNFADVKADIVSSDGKPIIKANKNTSAELKIADDMTSSTTPVTNQQGDEQQALFEIMRAISERGTAFAGVDVMAWQDEQRRDKELDSRSEVRGE